MISNVLNSATNLISNAQQKAASAAQTIATLPVQKDEVGGSQDIAPTELFKPIVSLKEAELENSAGVKLLKTHEKMVGALLDVKA
ncbi:MULTISPECIES: hypothetical protein [Methylomonas]|uniref:Flagellar biosynthesis protein FlgE n=1 Tax=Methylomonas koyamae TaxID=702114 RepID=A0A177NB59_9GAMM|nr:hypothetical protein [Methylomonas koyamae]OAI14439.1 hypothetical protein A1355_12460 [Methylomonas koyamae]